MTLVKPCAHGMGLARWCSRCAWESPEMVTATRTYTAGASEQPVAVWRHRCPRQSRPQRAGTALAWMFLGAALMVFVLGTLEAL